MCVLFFDWDYKEEGKNKRNSYSILVGKCEARADLLAKTFLNG